MGRFRRTVQLRREQEEAHSHEPEAVNQSRMVSGICDTAACLCEQRGSEWRMVEPYSFERTRRSKSTTVLRLLSLQAKRFRALRNRSAATGTVNWCNWSEYCSARAAIGGSLSTGMDRRVMNVQTGT